MNFLFRPPPHLLTLHTPIFDKLYEVKHIIKYFANFLFRPPPHLLTLHTPIFDKLYEL